MQRTWTASVTRGAQVLSHQNVHTYLTLHYNTVHYIPIHFSIFFNLFNCLKILSVYKSKEKPLCFPIVFPVALPRRWAEVLEPAFPPTRARALAERRRGWPEDFDPVPRDPVPALSRKPQRGVNGEMMQNEKCQKNENHRFLKTRKNCFCNIVKC